MNISPELLEFLSGLATPLMTLIGLIVGYQYSKNKTNAEGKKFEADAMKTKAEADALSLRNDANTIRFYVEQLEGLRKDIKLHEYQIKELTDRLMASDKEKLELKMENEKLLIRVAEQDAKIVEQDLKIAYLQQEIDRLVEMKNGNDRPTKES
jgi:predicted RNase H-like nuclease (RuvC/YqgF family)